MSAAGERRVRIDIAYDGTDFSGWQRQPGLRTVQGELETALARIQGGRPTTVRGAGRTDAGTHARRQVAAARVTTALDDGDLAYALRRLLPADLRPTGLWTVDDGFHPRRDALEKTYHYRVDRSRHGDPFIARFALHWPYALDVDPIREALAMVPGRRDWSAFAASSCELEDRVRTLTASSLEGDGDVLTFRFVGEGFLTHMVRILVGTCLEIGRGRFAPGRVAEALAARDRSLAGPTVAARGLILWNVRYPDDPVRFGSDSG